MANKFANTEQAITWLLESHPECRGSANRMIIGYWQWVDGVEKLSHFNHLTCAETILREARSVLKRRPELGWPSAGEKIRHDVQELFGPVEVSHA